ncbi:telomere length regulator protein (Rif1) [Hirsutella rhossiliensis]|uniref:Telomere length regulator protein (Rif1) n=1 Tax=Hirsutella rhossiliensis TaxID=111463 RepID=A0A9P8SE10_9HYPO|nr:telomere length regulator protein (Rif1) [Hirsutella rhossiliensis]KAH0957905.1 telomere length regulator protein (Rif1) [Hirsutella rhossiliensis]
MASSAAPAPSTRILTNLAARPPTPPREANHDADVSLRSVVLGISQSFDPCRSLQTPPGAHSPSSLVATGSDSSSDRVRKKVEWSSHTDYKDPPDYRDGARLDKSHLLSTPSSASSKPIKGILKPSPAPNLLASSLATQLDGTVTQLNLIEMLDSSIKQLAGPDRDSKLDAYMMLARALKTSNNLPDRVALQNKMSLFMQFIQRDITSKNDNGSLDNSLVNHALTLLATFLHFQAIASTITSDFGVFIIDHAIRSFEDPAIPKDIVRHLMQVVAFQNFSPKVMAPDRVGRLVAALHKIEDHVQGKSIVMSRLHIYKRLVKQARNSMLAHADWLKDMFTDMLSTVKDIRAQAISLGSEAGFGLRPDKLLFRKVADIFTATDDDESYIEFYIRRLQRMVKDKQTSFAVPQIWSVVILFLRCPFDRWEYYAPWLRLVQDAFNMTDGPTKQEANYAWNRYVCLSILDSKMGPKAVNTLCKPLLSQLRRKASPKQQDEAIKLRRIVLGGVCSLYYYAFAQGDEKCPTEVTWDVAVQPVMTQLIDLDGKPDVPGDCMMQAARMLAGLLDVSTPRPPRNPDRIMDTTPLKPEELLPIDSKWVRRNCEKVFEAIEPILEKKLVDLANKDSLVYRLWQALVGSVAAASAKDIKVSEDTVKFLACSLSLLARAWSKGSNEDDDSANAKFLPSVHHFVQVLVDGLGVLPFMEKKLSQSTPNTFEAVAAPLQRSEKSERPWGGHRTPLQHLVSMLSSIPPSFADDEELADFFQSVFGPFFKGRNTKARSELARELIQLLPRNTFSPYGPWLLAAEHMKSCLEKSPAGSGAGTSGSEKLLGPQYRELVSLLERGLASHPKLPADKWKCLFDLVSSGVFEEFGDAGRALVVIEPLAKAMLDNRLSNAALPSATSVQAMTMLFDAANLPRDRKALDAARLRLWGAPPATTKAGPSDPFDNLYKLANHQMEALYNTYPAVHCLSEWNAFAESVCMFFEKCSAVAVVKTMWKMQHGLSPWIEDEKNQLQLPDLAPVSRTLQQLWDHVCIKLAAHERFEKKDFDQVEPLLIAALRSRQAFVVNKAAGAWNTLVKDVEKVECSDNFSICHWSSGHGEPRPVVRNVAPGLQASYCLCFVSA